MASPIVAYFAGICTVVAALGIGFGSAIMLTSTTPVQKVPPTAFAKREQPLELQATPASVTVVAPAQPTAERSNDILSGLAPPLTASPVPKAEVVTRALSLNPPPAELAPVAAPAEVAQPVQTARPVATMGDNSAAKIKEVHKEKDILAPEKKPDRRVVERRQLTTVEKQKVSDEEPNPEPAPMSGEPDRPTREGF